MPAEAMLMTDVVGKLRNLRRYLPGTSDDLIHFATYYAEKLGPGPAGPPKKNGARPFIQLNNDWFVLFFYSKIGSDLFHYGPPERVFTSVRTFSFCAKQQTPCRERHGVLRTGSCLHGGDEVTGSVCAGRTAPRGR